jgi:hypothetical protein
MYYQIRKGIEPKAKESEYPRGFRLSKNKQKNRDVLIFFLTFFTSNFHLITVLKIKLI